MSIRAWVLSAVVVVLVAVVSNEIGYRNGKREGIRIVGSAIRGGIGDLIWGAATSGRDSPHEADSGWRETDDWYRRHPDAG